MCSPDAEKDVGLIAFMPISGEQSEVKLHFKDGGGFFVALINEAYVLSTSGTPSSDVKYIVRVPEVLMNAGQNNYIYLYPDFTPINIKNRSYSKKISQEIKEALNKS